MRVRVRELIFETAQECADHFKISINTVYCAIKRGTTDALGTGSGKSPRARTPVVPPKPIRIGTHDFPSKMAASLFLGKCKGFVYNVLKRRGEREGMIYLEGLLVAKLMQDSAREADRRTRETEHAYKLAVRDISPTAGATYYHGKLPPRQNISVD